MFYNQSIVCYMNVNETPFLRLVPLKLQSYLMKKEYLLDSSQLGYRRFKSIFILKTQRKTPSHHLQYRLKSVEHKHYKFSMTMNKTIEL